MKIVIDTNVLMAGILKDSIVRKILLSDNFYFFIPEHGIWSFDTHFQKQKEIFVITTKDIINNYRKIIEKF